MKYTILASGSKGNASIVETDNIRILIDCGTTKRYLTQRFEELGLQFNDIDAVLITHDHSDHTSQLKHFVGATIYCPSPNPYTNIQVEPYERFFVGDVDVFPIKTSHDDEYSVGYVITWNDTKLVYITDTGYVRDQDLVYIEDADYYILESNHDPEMLMKTSRPYYIKQRILSDEGHLSNDDAGQVLAKIVTERTKEVVLAHLSEQANTEMLAVQTAKKYIEYQEIQVRAAKQFQIMVGGKRE